MPHGAAGRWRTAPAYCHLGPGCGRRGAYHRQAGYPPVAHQRHLPGDGLAGPVRHRSSVPADAWAGYVLAHSGRSFIHGGRCALCGEVARAQQPPLWLPRDFPCIHPPGLYRPLYDAGSGHCLSFKHKKVPEAIASGTFFTSPEGGSPCGRPGAGTGQTGLRRTAPQWGRPTRRRPTHRCGTEGKRQAAVPSADARPIPPG